MNKSKVPTILAIFILTIGVGVGVFLLQRTQTFRLGASGENSPKNVRITNLTATSLTISWTTDKSTVGYVKYGSSSPTEVAHPTDESASFIHSITISNLNPQTSYSIIINNNGDDYNNNDLPWQATTASTLAPPTTSQIISGKVLLASGEPAANVLVYATTSGASPLSTTTSASGEWNIPISNARTTLLNSYITVTDTTLLEIFVEGGPLSIATAQIYFAAANPIPPITLGQVYDFRSEAPAEESELPEASLELPVETGSSPTSGFQISEAPASETESVTLESLDAGETIFTTTPQFFGSGPAGETITVTVESDNPQTDQITINSDGTWDWTPPEGLAEGEHTVTVTWQDESGLLHELSQLFIVQASDGEPSFESTPSGSTPSPTPTVKPSPTPTASATPTASPRVSIPSTESAVPVSGNNLPTIIFALTGLLLIGAGIGFIKIN